MNADQIVSFIRDLFKIGGTILIAKGIGDAAGWEAIAGGAAAVVGIVWSQLHHNANPTTPTLP